MTRETVDNIERVIVTWCLLGAREDTAKEAMDLICKYRDRDIIF